MMTFVKILPFQVAIGLYLGAVAFHPGLRAAPWPSWRGPSHNQISSETNFPVKWSATQNRLWRTPLPEGGNSSPIVWGKRVFITQAVRDGARRTVMAFDRDSGVKLWESGAGYELTDPRHETNPHCAASPVTDGERVIASFASAGIYAYDLEGKELWHSDLGLQKHTWGQGSSPVIHGDSVLVYHGPGKDSALCALDRKTGRMKWKVALPEEHPAERFDGFKGKTDGMIGSFSTPLLHRVQGRDEVVMSLPNRVRAFDPENGRERWSCDGMNPLIYTSVSAGEDRLVAMGGFFGSTMFIKTGGSGDVTSTHRSYYEQRAKKHRIGSPIIHKGHVYFSNTIGVAECVELKTGKTVWEERLPATKGKGETWASMVLAGERLYVVNQSGDTFVLRAAPEYELLSVNPLGELSNSTPAFSDSRIYLRTHDALWCVAENPAAK